MNTAQSPELLEQLQSKMREDGRRMDWLVRELNKEVTVSRGWVSALMNGRTPLTADWERRIRAILDC
jgi:plasmid maintenance system antidote protein VapI